MDDVYKLPLALPEQLLKRQRMTAMVNALKVILPATAVATLIIVALIVPTSVPTSFRLRDALLLCVLLFIALHSLSWFRYRHAKADETARRWYGYALRASVTLLVCYATLIIILNRVALSWPALGHESIGHLFFFYTGFLFQLGFLVYALASQRLPKDGYWLLLRIAALALAFGLGRITFNLVPAEAMRRFEQLQQPLIDALKRAPDPCAEFRNHLATATPEDRFKVPRLYFLGQRFLITFQAGGVAELDIDGSTVYFDSDENRWILHPNGSPAWESFQHTTEALRLC